VSWRAYREAEQLQDEELLSHIEERTDSDSTNDELRAPVVRIRIVQQGDGIASEGVERGLGAWVGDVRLAGELRPSAAAVSGFGVKVRSRSRPGAGAGLPQVLQASSLTAIHSLQPPNLPSSVAKNSVHRPLRTMSSEGTIAAVSPG
jgi:hypothetical protein